MLTANLGMSACWRDRGQLDADREPLDARQLEQWQRVTLVGSDERGKATMILPQLQAPYIVPEDSVVVEDMLA